MPVAAVLAQQRAGMPQGRSRFLRPRQCPVRCEQGTTFHRRRLCRGTRQNRRRLHCLGQITARERPLQRRLRASLTRLQRHAGRSEGPGVRYGPAHMRHREVVEGGKHDLSSDRTHRRGPASKITHPEPLVPGTRQRGTSLRREVRDGMDRFQPRPQPAGQFCVSDHQRSVPSPLPRRQPGLLQATPGDAGAPRPQRWSATACNDHNARRSAQ